MEENNLINKDTAPTGMIMDAVSIPESTKESVAATSAAVGGMRDATQQAYIPRKTRTLLRNHKKIGRNDPCPCGSGKKYKNCCLSSGKYEGVHEIGTEVEE